MALLFLPGGPPPLIVFVSLALALYLAVVELREVRPGYLWWTWWLLFVFITHFVGYLILRGYVAFRRSREARA